jgi:hypothetical protein
VLPCLFAKIGEQGDVAPRPTFVDLRQSYRTRTGTER